MQIMLFGYNIYFLLIIFAGSLFLTVGDIMAKAWVHHNKPLYYAVTLVLYMVGMIFLTISFKYKNIAVASMMLIALNVLTLALWSWIVYGEPLNKIEMTGLILGFTAMCMLEFGSQSVS
ncbi:MAG TPA: EamA family transporter [Alphaproteobacteria bacterium]